MRAAGIAFAVLFLAAISLSAANIRLYLTDGGYHLVREYQVQQDRVRFYSVERRDWEEIPLELVDLKRTRAEAASREAALAEETKLVAAEEQAERQQRAEASRVPSDPGVYLVDGDAVKPVPQAVARIVNSRGRSILQRLSPYPIVTGKNTIEVEGERSPNVVGNAQQEFYFRLALPEKFAILKVKVEPKKKSRVVQTWQIMPVSGDIEEQEESIPILHRQLDDGLYKIWPAAPLTPGEYAVVEYSAGQRNIQVWDFSYRPAGKP